MTKFRYYFCASVIALTQLLGANQATPANAQNTSQNSITQASSSQTLASESTQSSSCDDLHFLFARGSGSDLNAADVIAWRQALEQELVNSGLANQLSYHFYELGEASQSGAQYPAVAVSGSVTNYLNGLGAFFSAGAAGPFNASVREGQQEIQNYIENIAKTCPNTKFVLGGYSQGAMVVSGVLPKIPSTKIAYAATFGDPKLYLPEGKNLALCINPGLPLSEYRINVPYCAAYKGLLGSYEPYQPEGYSGKLGTWCNRYDIFCSRGGSFDDHMVYAAENWYADAAKVITTAIREQFSAPVTATATSTHDVAVVVDTTESMARFLPRAQAQIANLAEATWAKNGRIALYEYRDLAENFAPRQLCDFSCTAEQFYAELNSLSVHGGEDDPESALSAIKLALNQLKWRVGATKTVVLMTDADYLSPDRDGTTLTEVVNRTLEIDPVNIYAYTLNGSHENYQILTDQTGGKTLWLHDDLPNLAQTILNRPTIALSASSTTITKGQTLYLHATASSPNGQIAKFLWDLDFDGEFETETTPETYSQQSQTSLTHTFPTAKTGFLQVKAIDEAGALATMSLKITIQESVITSTPPLFSSPNLTPAQITNLSARSISATSMEVTYSATNTAKTIIILDGTLLGYLEDQTTFTVTDLTHAATLELVPYNSQGDRGERRKLILAPNLPTAPNAGAI